MGGQWRQGSACNASQQLSCSAMGDEEMFPSTHAVGHTPFLMHLLCFVGYHHRAERAATRLAHVHRTSLWAPGGFLAPVQATPPRRSILSADAGRGGGREWDEPI